jgi:hypothetical protein
MRACTSNIARALCSGVSWFKVFKKSWPSFAATSGDPDRRPATAQQLVLISSSDSSAPNGGPSCVAQTATSGHRSCFGRSLGIGCFFLPALLSSHFSTCFAPPTRTDQANRLQVHDHSSRFLAAGRDSPTTPAPKPAAEDLIPDGDRDGAPRAAGAGRNWHGIAR